MRIGRARPRAIADWHPDTTAGPVNPVIAPDVNRTFAALALRAGDTVLDLGCGSGLNFAGLQRMIGPSGRIICLDASSAILERAGSRTERHIGGRTSS